MGSRADIPVSWAKVCRVLLLGRSTRGWVDGHCACRSPGKCRARKHLAGSIRTRCIRIGTAAQPTVPLVRTYRRHSPGPGRPLVIL